ncbi:MAG: HDOD domain-containing protein [Candidatus Neomarinimicrobiota bacterium]|nr:MAG: HDOD domain-containing protein [Candidatus Neomarinimicrobiota bacterium]
MSVFTPDDYRQRIQELDGLPSLPSVAAEILALRREDKLSINQMLPTIEKDPPLAMKILKMANSAFYARRYKVDNLKQAIVTIGLNDLTYLVLSFSIIKSFVIEGDETYWINWSDFWRHSVASAHVAQYLARNWRLPLHSNPYAMGLLHDVGKLVLFRLDQGRFMKTLSDIREQKLSSIEAERNHFGITHQEAGLWLSEKWMMPESIQQAMGFHHQPVACTAEGVRDLVALIQITDAVCNEYQPNLVDLALDGAMEDLQGWQILQPELENPDQTSMEEVWGMVVGELPQIDSVLALVKGE